MFDRVMTDTTWIILTHLPRKKKREILRLWPTGAVSEWILLMLRWGS